MRRAMICLGMFLMCSFAFAEEEAESPSFRLDAREFALSFGRGRIQWRFEAYDLLQLPVVEPFDGIILSDDVLLTQEFLNPGVEFDDEPRIFLTISFDW